jgi:hypothetical protein
MQKMSSFVTELSGQSVDPIFKGLDVQREMGNLTHDKATDMLSRNVCKNDLLMLRTV